ncbi:MAG: pilus assembly protein [Deltaproteobacteria bacterium]|nr:pilus assembly protein [Deltaproteobacteria bacterium]
MNSAFRSRGASIVEFVLLLPLFLFLMLFFIWYGVSLNAKTSLISAVTNGVRLAATRGKASVYRKVGNIAGLDTWAGAISDIDEAHTTGPTARVGNPGGLLVSPHEVFDVYNAKATSTFGRGMLSIPFPEYTYAVAYAVQMMRMSVGSALRFPCDPYGADGDGCLMCRPVNPDTYSDAPYTAPLDATGTAARRIAVRCDYKPKSVVLTPLLRMLSIVTGTSTTGGAGFGVISHAASFDNYHLCYLKEDTLSGTLEVCCPDSPCS